MRRYYCASPEEETLARQRSVLQQDSATRSEIEQCARRVANRDPSLSWLRVVLEARGINPSNGILAAYSEKADPVGRLGTGTWLTGSGEFLDFRVHIPIGKDDRPIVKSFDERSVSVFAHERGIAKSFGALAIEVRDEILVGSRDD